MRYWGTTLSLVVVDIPQSHRGWKKYEEILCQLIVVDVDRGFMPFNHSMVVICLTHT